VYSIPHYVIKFVSDLRQVSGFLRVLRFPPPIKPQRYNWNIVESGIKHHTPNTPHIGELHILFFTHIWWTYRIGEVISHREETVFSLYHVFPWGSNDMRIGNTGIWYYSVYGATLWIALCVRIPLRWGVLDITFYGATLWLTLWVRIPLRWGVLDRTFYGATLWLTLWVRCDNVCQWLTIGRRYSSGTPVSSISKSDDIAEELEDTKVVIRSRISKKNRQQNGQKKKYKRTNDDLQNIQIKLKIE
jgi:hypothetical protein